MVYISYNIVTDVTKNIVMVTRKIGMYKNMYNNDYNNLS